MKQSKKPFASRLLADGLFTFGGRIFNMVLAAVLGILTARVLGPHGRGIYALPMIASALATAGFAGLTSATSFFLLREASGRAVVRPALLCAAGFFVIGAAIAVAAVTVEHAMWAAIPAVLSLVGPIGTMIALGYSTGTHRVRLNTTFTLYSTALTIVAIGAGFLLVGHAPTVAIGGWIAGTDTIALVLLAWVIADSRRLPAGTPIPLRSFLSFAGKTGAVQLVSLLNYRADVYIVALLTSPALLGMYTIAVTAAETLLATTQVTNVVASPHIGSLGEAESARLVSRCVRHNVLVAGVSSLALALLAPVAVKLLYGAAFLPMVPALRLLLIGVFALSLGSPMSTFFTIRQGRPVVPFVLASASAITCIVVSLLLVPRLGLAGAAIGSTLGYVMSQSAALVYFSRIAGISLADMLFPRGSDIWAYVNAARNLIRT